jgi:uncharacterized membrane protein
MFDFLTVVATSLNVQWQQFVTIMLLIFGLFLILAGLFTAYFGSGKSRMIGYALFAVGAVAGIATALWYHYAYAALGSLIYVTFLVLLAAVIGALIAVGIFLVAIMKS